MAMWETFADYTGDRALEQTCDHFNAAGIVH
jgi:hypothetical protein